MNDRTPSVNGTDVAPGEPKRILFVDDEPDLLEGVRDALRAHRREWTMSFASNGEDALAMLAADSCDVVISDLRMPGIDSARLFELIRDRYPTAVRIVLSGHADLRMVARAAATAHRLIAKPCETVELARVIERSCALQALATRVEHDRRAIGASALPSVPRLYAELSELLSSGDANAADAGWIVEKDIAMAAKVLQLANSAYFGRRARITNVTEAVAYLGLETLRALLLHTEAFRMFAVGRPIPGFDLEELHRHCTRVARLAAVLAAETRGGADAFTAALLHDVGLLVLASEDPDGLASTVARAREQRRPIHQIEHEQYGVTHAEVGAHVLALWGLPHSVIEVVAGHHNREWLKLPFDRVAAIQIANVLVEQVEAERLPDPSPPSPLDLDYLADAGLTALLEDWRELAIRQFDEGPA